MTRTLHPRRGGFTLIEVLVAAGLSMLIMALVTQMMARGLDTLSELKSVTQLSQSLRAFEGAMRADLAADHFEGRNGPKVSDYPLPKTKQFSTNAASLPEWRSPTKGFFSIRQQSDPTNPDTRSFGKSIPEGIDSDLNVSTRATSHILHMTVKRNPTRGDKVFSAQLPAAQANALNSLSLSQMANQSNIISSSWAEVIYFLDTTDAAMGQTPGGTPLYGLYRRVRVIPEYGTPQATAWKPTLQSLATADERTACQGLSFAPGVRAVALPAGTTNIDHPLNDPVLIRNPLNRLGGINAARTGATDKFDFIAREQDYINNNATGGDLLLGDVLSFEIKADWDYEDQFSTGPSMNRLYLKPGTPGPNQTNFPQFDLSRTFEFPFSDLPLAVRVPPPMNPPTMNARNTLIGATRAFDTWYETTGPNSWTGEGHRDAMPLQIRLRAVQIKVRVWDRHINRARQVTIIQDL